MSDTHPIDDSDDSTDTQPTCWNCGTTHDTCEFGVPTDQRGLFADACPCCGARYPVPAAEPRHFETVVRSPDHVPSYTLDAQEVRRRVPALKHIVDSTIEQAVVDLTADAPTYFWRVPAASPDSEYHHPACRQRHGLWAHTLLLTTPILELFDSYEELGRLSIEQRDHALAAALLHDQRKRGPHGTTETTALRDHDLMMAGIIERDSRLPQSVADAVASHMGPWYQGPEPESELARLVHDADMLASSSLVEPQLPAPVPDELAALDVGVADD